MKQTQPKQHSSTSETTAQRQSVERPRRLRIDLLEARVAPIAIWGE
jgi:hypothetical protein